jgi:hypothetical protein
MFNDDLSQSRVLVLQPLLFLERCYEILQCKMTRKLSAHYD